VPYGSYCFDIAARRDLVLMLKILVNVDSMDAVQAEQLKRLCYLVSGFPLLVGDRTRTERIEDDVVHERYDLPAINIETLRLLLESGALPLIYGTKGGYYVRIDGKTLKEERKRRGLSLGQLGDMVGVSRESIYNYEHNGSASVETAMALVEKLGVDLIKPVEILKRVNMQIEPDINIENQLLKFVAIKLNHLGFGVYRTPRTPFHAVAQESRDKLLTGVFEHYQNLTQNAQVISSLSHVIDITTFLVSHELPNLDHIEGIAILREDEFEDIDRKSDLNGMIKEKQHS
jgi:putative transcriptional regulator